MVDQIKDRDWHFYHKLEELQNGNLLMKMKIDINHELVTWLMARLPDVIIHEPEELVDLVQERLKGFQAEHNL